MGMGEGDQTCVSNIHLRSEPLHQREDPVRIILQNRNNSHTRDKSVQRLYRRWMIFQQMARFGDDGFAGKNSRR